MAIETTVEPRLKWWTVAYLVICLALGLWGLYDYAIRLPNNQRTFDRFQAVSSELADFQTRAEMGTLDDASRVRAIALDTELGELAPGGHVPSEPAKWDRWVKLWLYVISCGVIGVPWFAWKLVSLSRRRYRLEDDGTLVHPGGRWSAGEISGIDMSRWMEKSIATVIHRDGSRAPLDAYKYRNLHLIIGSIAHRFDPGVWHADGRMVREKESARPDAIGEAESAPADGPAVDVMVDDSGPADPTRT